MPRKIFINLPVSDLARSRRFYEALGFTIDARFSDDTAAAVSLDAHINVMLLTHAKFAEFAPSPVADTLRFSAVLNCLSCDSREEVDAFIKRAARAGGKTGWRAPQEYGFMYGEGFQDPDGHVWEVMWMDEAQMTANQAAG
ncbi:MAG: VOC family protein [Oceanicaulis sp.]